MASPAAAADKLTTGVNNALAEAQKATNAGDLARATAAVDEGAATSAGQDRL